MQSTAIHPDVRFPGFDEPWRAVRLGDVAELVTEKVGAGKCIPMSVSSGKGLIPQTVKFGRVVAGGQLKNYTVIHKYDFAYNKSATSLYPEGYIAMLDDYESGAVPNSIFTCFRIKAGVNPFYLNHLFSSNYHGKWLGRFIEVGARAHGSLSINDENLLNLPLPIPSLDEQQRIASCLSSLDDIIKETERKIESLKKHKKGLMQRLFANQMSSGIDSSGFAKGWMETTLGEICEMAAGRYISASEISSSGTYPCYGGNGLRGYTQKANITGVHPIIGRQGALCGNVLLADGSYYATEHAVVVTNKPVADVIFLYHLLNYLDLNKYATGQAQPGLSVAKMLLVSCQIPTSMVQQQKIASCLSSTDNIITSYEEKLRLLRLHKKGLMQQLFPPVRDKQ